jgi:hypothetical protein
MSALEIVVAYLRQRARLRLLVPLSILLAVAGRLFVAPSTAGVSAMAIATFQALGLVLAFRIWDDIEDRDVDRVRRPDRVLVAAPTTAPFRALGVALAIASIIPLLILAFALRRLAAISLAAVLLSIWYGVRSHDGRRHALGEHLLAVKYPLISYSVAPELPSEAVTWRIAVILAVVYGLICVYEYADDIELRQVFTSRRSVS